MSRVRESPRRTEIRSEFRYARLVRERSKAGVGLLVDCNVFVTGVFSIPVPNFSFYVRAVFDL